jgi:hypothetical protein
MQTIQASTRWSRLATAPELRITLRRVSASGLFERGYSMVAAGSDVTMLRQGLTDLKNLG